MKITWHFPYCLIVVQCDEFNARDSCIFYCNSWIATTSLSSSDSNLS